VGEVDGLKMVGDLIQIDQEHVQRHIDRVVRSSMADTINMMDAEAKLCNAGRYERF